MRRLPGLGLLLPLLPLACSHEQAPAAGAPKTPEVSVAVPILRTVTDHEVFTGHIESAERVELRAQVTAPLLKTDFVEGALVPEGKVLFYLDPDTFAAQVARDEANLALAQAHRDRLQRDYDRALTLLPERAIGREEFERIRGDRDEAVASVGVAEQNLRRSRLDLRYTEVRAPCTGRVSRRLVDPGNTVKAYETVLTTLVGVGKIYAYFDVDERTVLAKLLREGTLATARENGLPVRVGLIDEAGRFPHPAKVNFVDALVNTSTGTMWLRAELDPPRWWMKRRISHGLFVRVQLPLGQPHEGVLVAEQALGSDQGQRFVFVVGSDGTAEYRRVEVGRAHGGLREITSGLSAGERVVVSGLQRVRDKNKVVAKLVEMPDKPPTH
jgi:RND family efflux transporter MFP subunit